LIVVDDLLLLHIVARRTHPAVDSYVASAARGDVFTTGSWYWRLARAITRPGRGVFSQYLGTSSADERLRVGAAVENLPHGLGVLSLRRLVPIMAALPGQLNLLTAEAVAAAIVLAASIAVTTRSNLLTQAAAAVNVSVELVDLHS
jgi:hypothetical protein